MDGGDPQLEKISVSIVTTEWGEFDLILSIGDRSLKIYLAYGCFCFEHFISWLKTVEIGSAQKPYPIDEEGPDKALVIEPLVAPGLIGFRVVDPYAEEETVFIRGILERKQFISAIKQEIFRYFKEEFVIEKFIGYIPPGALETALMEYLGPEKFREEYGERQQSFEQEPPQMHFGERILADPWFADQF